MRKSISWNHEVNNGHTILIDFSFLHRNIPLHNQIACGRWCRSTAGVSTTTDSTGAAVAATEGATGGATTGCAGDEVTGVSTTIGGVSSSGFASGLTLPSSFSAIPLPSSITSPVARSPEFGIAV